MKGKPSLWHGRLARLVALAVVIALAPLPLAAADQTSPGATPGIKASVQKAVATVRLQDPAQKPMRAEKSAGPDLTSGSFFKSPAGIAVLCVVAAGAGYAIYSTSHDRVKSQVR